MSRSPRNTFLSPSTECVEVLYPLWSRLPSLPHSKTPLLCYTAFLPATFSLYTFQFQLCFIIMNVINISTAVSLQLGDWAWGSKLNGKRMSLVMQMGWKKSNTLLWKSPVILCCGRYTDKAVHLRFKQGRYKVVLVFN
jgi:hypothetical protein